MKNFKGIFKTLERKFSEHSPVILVGIGITGMISATVLAVRSTPKAMELIEEKKEELDTDELTKREIIKTCWKCYIPTMVSTGVSIASLIGANSVNSKRNAALATAYKISEKAYNEYKEKVIETIGEKEEKNIREKIAEEKIQKNPLKNNEVIITGNGDTLCYDSISGRYFECNMDKIRKAENILNRMLVTDMYASLNDFYDLIELPPISIGSELGWNVDYGLVEIEFSSQISEDDRPCIVLDYSIAPKQRYHSMM